MKGSEPLPDAVVELVARRFRVLSEPARIKLLDTLRTGPASVGELGARLGMTQQNTSKHLGVLATAEGSRPVAVRYETPYSDLHADDLLVTMKPLEGSNSRLCSFSMWQYPMRRLALCPSQMRSAFLVAAYLRAV